MKPTLIVWCMILLQSTNCQIATIVEVNVIVPEEIVIIDSPLSYPTAGVDVIWKFSQSIEFNVTKFVIDGQIGDFVLISEHPFPLPAANDVPVTDIFPKLPIGETVILSWSTQFGKNVRLVNPKGVFIYFHGEKEVRQLQQPGIQLHVMAFDASDEEPSTTAEPPPTIPPGQTIEDYVTKYVIGKTPNQFLIDLDIFKSILAAMSNKYCEAKGFQRPNITIPSDVHIPLNELRFCDRSWPEYKTCVEVTFSIVTYNYMGEYVMTGVRIEEMWNLYSGDMTDFGYFPYNPPTSSSRAVGWVWIAVCLGAVLFVAFILCLAWLKRASDEIKKDAEVSKALTEVVDEEKFYDRENPVHHIRKTMINGRLVRDEDYSSGTSGDRNMIHEFTGRNPQNTKPSFGYDPYMSGDPYRTNKLYGQDDEKYFEKPNINSRPWETFRSGSS